MKVAVFDLDGTITRRDTLWPYLRGWVRRTRRGGFWPRAVAAAARFPIDRDRGQLKFELIRAAMGGATRDAYVPDQLRADAYDGLYAHYLRLHDHFGRGGDDVMHRLRDVRPRELARD